MKSRAIVWLAVAAMGAGAALGCDGGDSVADPGAGGSGGAMGDGGAAGAGGVLPLNGGGDVCGGCFRGGECVPGADLDACGADGEKCAACSFGETCMHAACETIPSTCITKLEETEALMGTCSADAECDTDEWCQASCCDPVSHLCFAVGACRKKFATGERCSYDGGGHECASGVCDPITDLCQ